MGDCSALQFAATPIAKIQTRSTSGRRLQATIRTSLEMSSHRARQGTIILPQDGGRDKHNRLGHRHLLGGLLRRSGGLKESAQAFDLLSPKKGGHRSTTFRDQSLL